MKKKERKTKLFLLPFTSPYLAKQERERERKRKREKEREKERERQTDRKMIERERYLNKREKSISFWPDLLLRISISLKKMQHIRFFFC